MALGIHLVHNQIPHLVEPYYPSDEKLNPTGLMRADWKVDDYLIEFFGLIGMEEYEEKIKQKRELAKRTNIKLIEIYPDDLYDLDKKLRKLKEG